MRELTPAQQDILKKHPDISSVDELPDDEWEEIQELGDFEEIYQATDIFLWDQYMSFEEQQWKLL